MVSTLGISEFLEPFSPISLHHSKPISNFFGNPWVFWSESEGCENNSSSADLATTPMIHEMIISALSSTRHDHSFFFAQFWAPVTIASRRLLSTSHQPFALRPLSNDFAQYRLRSEKYKYNIDDANKLHIEPDYMILSGGPATAFLNCRTSIDEPQGFLLEFNDELISVMVPICFPSQSNCIGVLDFTLRKRGLASFLFDTVEAIKDAGLDVFYVQPLIPYQAISGLEVAKDEIEEALKVVCQSHNLPLAQVWIPYEDTNNVPSLYSFEDTQTKRLLAIKLTGYLYDVAARGDYADFEKYFRFGDVMPYAIGEEFPLVTLQDYESHYMSKLHSDMHINWDNHLCPFSALAICLRSNDTADFNYAFEFIWTQHSNYVIFLEAILLTLKRCLPRFKFASGAELGDELYVILVENSTVDEEDVILVESSTDDEGDEIVESSTNGENNEIVESSTHDEDDEIGETKRFKIFQEKRSSPMPKAPEKGKKPMVVEPIAPSKDLNEWPGPNFVKRNRNDSSVIQINTNEEDNGGEPGDEFDVIVVQDATHNEACEISESERIKIFQEERSSPMPTAPEKGKNPMVVDLIAPSKVTCKTAPKVLPREVIEKQFGKTMKEAAKDLNVSLSTLKRKVKELKIPEWPGPNVVKRNRNDSSIIQMNTNEEDNGAIEETSTVNLNKNVLTIKAEYADDMIKFHLPISQATFVRVEKEIGMKLKLSDKTYKLKYLDEDGDWIILTSDEEMADCIKSSRKSDRIVVRLRVVSSLQPISGPN